MKKIVGIMAVAAMATSMFAADVAARVKLTGNIASGDTKGNANLLTLKSTDQKDDDALIVSVNGDKAGAKFQFWYKYDGVSTDTLLASSYKVNSWDDEETKVHGIKDSGNQLLRVRGTSIWFKPIDMIKVTVGDVSTKLFGETLHYWKDPAGTAWNQYYNGYSGYGTVEGAGANIDVTPVSGLLITAGYVAKTDSSFVTFASGADPVVANYGAGVKYDLNGAVGIPLAVGVEFRSAGTKAEKVLGIGATYGGRYAAGFYGMVEARLRMNEKNAGKLDGITINNHFRYAAGALECQLRAPVTIRLADNDPSWLAFSAKVGYNINGYTPYLLIGNDLNNAGAYKLSKDFADTFAMQIQPGVTFSVGACSFDVAAKIDIAAKYGANENAVTWAVPFEMSLKF